MPSIPITDGLSVTADADPAPWSSLAKYAKDLPHFVASGGDLSQWQALTVGNPAIHSLDTGLALERPVDFGADGPALTLNAAAAVHFEILTGSFFSPDLYGDNLAIPDDQRAVRLGLSASAGPSLSLTSGAMTFGLNASAGISIDSYRLFPAGPAAPTVLDALKLSIAEFVVPMQPADVAAIPVGVVVTLGGQGSLKFSASANLLAIANPLATVALPAPLPGLAVKASASVKVGAAWEIAAEYQVRVHRVDAARVRLGWYRKHTSEFTVSASARAGISAGTASEDLFPRIVGALSPDATAAEAQNVPGVEDAVKRAVNRKLEVSLAAEFGSLTGDEAAFLYELDLAAMDDAARASLAHALHGDLSGFTTPPAGVTEVRSILTHAQASRFTFKVNLLGIFNFISISRLALQGTVTWTPSTGELVIVDKATASRIQAASVNFGADEEKLRHVMAESFLITAAYRGSRSALAPPEMKSTHSYFCLENSASRDKLLRFTMALAALGLPSPAVPAGVSNFGRTTVSADASYDNAASLTLFLRGDGTPRPVAEYENAGRLALQLLVPASGDDAFRLRPAADDVLWAKMKEGPTTFGTLFPAAQVGGITADYLAIRWWADTMHETAGLIQQILRPGAADVESLRQNLANHLREVAARAHTQFGSPWGLIAMFLVSGGRAVPAGSITCARLASPPPQALAMG